MDQAPGPIIANEAPDVANIKGIAALPALETAIHNSMTAIKVPQIGVHKPRRRSTPAPAPITYGKIRAKCKGSLRCPNPEQSRIVAVTTRCRRRPMPGQLFGNVEKRRCKNTPFIFSLGYSQQAQNTQMKVSASSFWGRAKAR